MENNSGRKGDRCLFRVGAQRSSRSVAASAPGLLTWFPQLWSCLAPKQKAVTAFTITASSVSASCYLPGPSPRQHSARSFRFHGFRKHRENSVSSRRCFLSKTDSLRWNPFWSCLATKKKTATANYGHCLFCVGIVLSSRSVARQVFSPPVSLTAVFGMGTGGPSPS